MYLFSKLEKTKKKGNKNAKLNDTKSEITQDKAGIFSGFVWNRQKPEHKLSCFRFRDYAVFWQPDVTDS